MGHYTDEREAPDWMGAKPKTLPKAHADIIAEFWKEMAGRSLTPTGVERALEVVLAKHQPERAGFDTIAQNFRDVFWEWNSDHDENATVAMEKALEAIQPMVWPAKVYTVNIVGPATINHTGELIANHRHPVQVKEVKIRSDETAAPAAAPEFRILDKMTREQRAALLKLKTEAGSSQVRLEEAMADGPLKAGGLATTEANEAYQRLLDLLMESFEPKREVGYLIAEAIEKLVEAMIGESRK